MKTFLLFCSLIAGSSLGEILSAKGMQQIGDVSFRPRALLGAFWRMLRNPYLIAGVACLALSFFSFIGLLSYADLSFVVPLTAVGYILNTLGARFFLHEHVSRERWLGTLLVTFGIALISLSGAVETWLAEQARGFLPTLFSLLGPEEWFSPQTSPFAFWLLFGIRAVLLACVLAAIFYYGLALFAGLAWFADCRRQRALGDNFTPPVSIFKPVYGADDEAYDNFASFCRQEYPEVQILFGVRSENDPAIPLIRRLITDFPARDISLIVSDHVIGHNPKVSNLNNLFPHAKHDVLLIADSDIRVTPDYLRRVVAPLQQENVGMVTCLYRGTAANTWAARLEAIGLSATFAPDVCAARLLGGISFAFGSTIVMRRDLLKAIGGFPAIANSLADDFLLGNRTAKSGAEVILSEYVVEHLTGPLTWNAMWKHQLRWARAMYVSQPWGYRGLLVTYGVATSLLALLAWGFSGFAWSLLAVTLAMRMLPGLVIGRYGLKDRALTRYLWLLPVRDILSFAVWLASFASDKIEWRGAQFRLLANGELTPTEKSYVPEPHHNFIMDIEKDNK